MSRWSGSSLLVFFALQAANELGMPAGGLRLERPKQKQRSSCYFACPLINWERVAAPFFEIIWNGAAPIIVNYGHIYVHRAQSAVPGALTPRKTIAKNN